MCGIRLINRFEAAALLGIFLSVLTANIAVFGQECAQLRAEVVRLHILANSDSETDQKTKLLVRDRILAELGPVFETPGSQAQAKQIAKSSLPRIEQIAADTLAEMGEQGAVRAELCRMYFSTRDYENYSLPAGMYDAVRISLGEAKGKNWWCVMYPPICVPAALADPEQLENLPAMQDLQSVNGEPMFKPKLAIVELFEKAASALQ